MGGQRGSILVGVIALSLAMTIAAASYILQAGATVGNFQTNLEARKLRISGESTAQLAVRYMRDITASKLNPPIKNTFLAEGDTIGITPGYPSYTIFSSPQVQSAMGNPRIRASYTRKADTLRVLAWATFGPKSDTILISWKISHAVATTNPCHVHPYCMAVVTLKDWKDSLIVNR